MARSVEEVTNGVAIRWTEDIENYGEDHVTELSFDLLSQLVGTGTTAPSQEAIPRSVWDSQMFVNETSDFSYDEYMTDDFVLLKALRQLHTHGLLFVTNVPESERSVETVAERIGPLKTTFYGRTWDVRSVPDAINVAYTSQNLGFHMDLMYMKQPPHLQLLHCIRSSAAGGASLFTDSFRAAVDLAGWDRSAFNVLSIMNADFHYDHPGSQYYHQSRPVIEHKEIQFGLWRTPTWNSFRKFRSEGRLEGWPKLNPIDYIDSVAWAPPFQAPFSLQGPLLDPVKASDALNADVGKWHAAAKQFEAFIHRDEMIYERMMKPSECVIFDNRRVLHARRAFEVGDAGKERWLRGAYIDKDPYMSRLKILRDIHEAKPGPREPRPWDVFQRW